MRTWSTEEIAGRGTRHILTIDPEDGTNPIIVRGWTKDEVLEKVSHSLETGQQIINRQRQAAANGNGHRPPAGPPAPPAAPAGPRPLTVEEQAQATMDLSNPARAPQAIKTLLRGAGLDVDAISANNDTTRVLRMCTAWEAAHPEFPAEERNQRVLLNTAAKNVGFRNIDIAALDAAYAEMLRFGLIFEASDIEPSNNPPTPSSQGNSDRVERPRGATSYNARDFRASAPVAQNKPRYTKAQIDAMTSAQLRDKIEHEPGFADWYNREFSSRPAA